MSILLSAVYWWARLGPLDEYDPGANGDPDSLWGEDEADGEYDEFAGEDEEWWEEDDGEDEAEGADG